MDEINFIDLNNVAPLEETIKKSLNMKLLTRIDREKPNSYHMYFSEYRTTLSDNRLNFLGLTPA